MSIGGDSSSRGLWYHTRERMDGGTAGNSTFVLSLSLIAVRCCGMETEKGGRGIEMAVRECEMWNNKAIVVQGSEKEAERGKGKKERSVSTVAVNWEQEAESFVAIAMYPTVEGAGWGEEEREEEEVASGPYHPLWVQ